LIHTPYQVLYNATKHALVTLMAGLRQELEAAGAPVTVSMLCPGFVNTSILEAQSRRPERLRNPEPVADTWQSRGPYEQMIQEAIISAIPAEQVAARAVEGIAAGAFWITTDSGWRSIYLRQTDQLLANSPPSFGPEDIAALRGDPAGAED
jgi:short-subunit dehydrogenase